MTTTTIRPLSERIKDIHLVDGVDTGLANDVSAAARNRENIERMRKLDTYHAQSGLRVQSLLDKPNEIKKEKEIEKMTIPVVKVTEEEVKKLGIKLPPEKSKGQILYETHAKEVGLKTEWRDMGQENRERYERKAGGSGIVKPTRGGNGRINDGRDFEKEKDAILADYKSMKLVAMLRKHHLSTTRWYELKIKWNVPKKGYFNPPEMVIVTLSMPKEVVHKLMSIGFHRVYNEWEQKVLASK